MHLIIHTDGGARHNPGPAAVGVVIEEVKRSAISHQSSDKVSPVAEGKELKTTVAEFGKYIGETTNNVAEYTAVIEALKFIKTYQVSGVKFQDKDTIQLDFFIDSTLVVNQLNGLFKVKDARIRELVTQVRVLEQETGCDIRYTVIPREQNSRADYFVNKALDENR